MVLVDTVFCIFSTNIYHYFLREEIRSLKKTFSRLRRTRACAYEKSILLVFSVLRVHTNISPKFLDFYYNFHQIALKMCPP